MNKARLHYTRRQFLVAAGGAMAAACAWGGAAILTRRRRCNRIIVLGIDGMDPGLLERYRREGRMPNAETLAQCGCFRPLRTTCPPQSPVAWSDFVSGTNPGGHGIFDFIARDAETLTPYLSTARTRPPDTWKLGNFAVPLGRPRTELLRQGPTLWRELERSGFPSRVLRAPVNFPPTPTRAHTLSGLTTPDIHGSYGVFTLFTTDPGRKPEDVPGGRIRRMDMREHRATCLLEGPVNSFRSDADPVMVPIVVDRDPQRPVLRVRAQQAEIYLREGEWSDWITLRFSMLPPFVETSGICRLYAKRVHPRCELYVSPINIDPADPAMPISTPGDYAPELAKALGKFYTQGMPEDTAALSSGVFNDDEYREQALFVTEESMRLYEHELRRFREGFFYAYFSTLDLNSHAFWRTLDCEHPLFTPELAARHGDFLPRLYERMDQAIGMALAAADNRTWVLAVSDHGFCSFRRQFHLNSWLMDNGYAKPLEPRERGQDAFFSNVDWTRTRAYGLGINGLYLNLKEREPEGIVAPGDEAERLRSELLEKLLALRDPETGERVVAGVYRPEDIYSGPNVKKAPDLIVGYNVNYRASWKTVLGSYPFATIEDNLDPWSGDHCMDPQFIPGVLLSSLPLTGEHPALMDLAPTIFAAADVPVPAACTGRNLLT